MWKLKNFKHKCHSFPCLNSNPLEICFASNSDVIRRLASSSSLPCSLFSVSMCFRLPLAHPEQPTPPSSSYFLIFLHFSPSFLTSSCSCCSLRRLYSSFRFLSVKHLGRDSRRKRLNTTDYGLGSISSSSWICNVLP